MADPHPVTVAVLDERTVRLHELDLPPAVNGEIDVDITLAAICGSDIHTVLGHRPAPPMTALGHEAVGRIAVAPPDVRDLRGVPLRVGDRVALSMITSCGACDRCLAGLTMKCRSLFKYGHASVEQYPHASGMLATRVRILPGTPILRIPDALSDAVMVSAGCAVATAGAIVHAASPRAGDQALVLGGGAVGLYTAAMLSSAGCVVTVQDPSPSRRDLAAALGLRASADSASATNGVEPSIIVEASGDSRAAAAAFEAAAVGGHVIGAGSVSPGSTTMAVDPAILVTRRLRYSGVHNYTADEFRWSVDWLLAFGPSLPVDRMLSRPYPLERIGEAMAELRSGEVPRVAVDPRLMSSRAESSPQS